jgi:hypothetical protein
MNRPTWLILTLLFCVHFTLNLLLPWAMSFGPKVLLVWPLIGVTISQVNLIAAWMVFAPGSIGRRWPWAMLMAGGMWYSLVIGNRWHSHWMRAGDALQLGVILLVGLLIAQAPLWITRQLLAYRHYRLGPTQLRDATAVQFHLRDLLIAMGLLSVLLGAARWILPPGNWWESRWDTELFVIMTTVTIANLIVTLPAMGILFLRRRKWVVGGIAALFPYCLVVSFVEFQALTAMLGNPGEESAAGLFLLNTAQITSVIGTLALFRWQGFRWLTQSEWQAQQRSAGQVEAVADRAELDTQ